MHRIKEKEEITYQISLDIYQHTYYHAESKKGRD